MIMLIELTMLGTDVRSMSQGISENEEFSYSGNTAFSFSQNIAFTYWNNEEM